MDEDMQYDAAAVFQQAAQQYQNQATQNSGDRKMLYVPMYLWPLRRSYWLPLLETWYSCRTVLEAKEAT